MGTTFNSSGFDGLNGTDNMDNEALDMGDMSMAQDQNISWRLRAVRQAESSLAQLQNMFTQFAGLLADQGEMLEHIDHNIDQSVLYVDETHTILKRSFDSIKRNRSLVIKILIFVAVVVIIFFIFYR